MITSLNRYSKEIALVLMSTFISGSYAMAKLRMPIEAAFRPSIQHAALGAATGHRSIAGMPASGRAATRASIQQQHQAAPEFKGFIGGPSQPEMQSFQSVNTNNLVDLFTGDFSYNIPLLDVGGYPIGIHYNSGVTMDQEASWVGLGWNINPGTIARSMRGIPDDFDGTEKIKKTLNIKANNTFGVTAGANFEMAGKDLKLGVNLGIEYNNYNGPSLSLGLSPTLKLARDAEGDKNGSTDTVGVSAGLSLNASSSGGLGINPNFQTRIANANKTISYGSIGLNLNTRKGLESLTISTDARKDEDKAKMVRSWDYTFARPSSIPIVTVPYTSRQFTLAVKGGAAFTFAHPNLSVSGYFSSQYIADKDRVRYQPAYGYMHFTKGDADDNALMDFNREDDYPYDNGLPRIGAPVFTFDTYTISAEGSGGTFRPYRGEVGIISDHYMRTNSVSATVSVDAGAGFIAHAGADVSPVYSYTENKKWVGSNSIGNRLKFEKSSGDFEEVYFRNPSEKSINAESYYNSLGNESLVAVALDGSVTAPQAKSQFQKYTKTLQEDGTVNVSGAVKRSSRDKRSQLISYLTADNARLAGLDTTINIYPYNSFPLCDCPGNVLGQCSTITKESRVTDMRKGHHISQITVLNPDGKRYVYGIPAYNMLQREVSFATSNADLGNGTVSYNPGVDNSVDNAQNKDHYFSSEEIPAYAHSFLLTGLLSPDYVDITGNGISADDLGDAVKFNYTRIYSSSSPFKWRTPFTQNVASLNLGLRADKNDNRASYVYGEKEIWYTNSIESKTMVATFTLEDRADANGVNGENGGRSSSQGLKRLKEINLYAKADLLTYGTAAKPIKTVHFSYSYTLCSGIESGTSGKLTLDSIWFSYNKNTKGRLNPYVFKYHTTNPAYAKDKYDRWGNYKASSSNPASLTNEEYPYATQDSLTAATNASAWNLEQIYLPAGGRMSIDYEADDYAYVQDKRAMQMFQVLGFARTADSTDIMGYLYDSGTDRNYVFLNLPYPVASLSQFEHDFIPADRKMFIRLMVKVPGNDNVYEYIPAYVTIDDFGIAHTGSQKVWIKMGQVGSQSSLVTTCSQFLKYNLPFRAYPNSDLSGVDAPEAAVRMLAGMAGSFASAFQSFEGELRNKLWMHDVDVSKSFARLNNPIYKKYGGGHRVKRVLLYDNWNQMTGQKEAVYGQEYKYTTIKEIDGQMREISSGVATYEPMMGNEENPFHVPVDYQIKAALIGPAEGKFIDHPVAETFYPSAGVGYSKVRVSSINRKNLRSASGFEESEFYTAYDFPVSSVASPLKKTRFNSPILSFLQISFKYLTLSQGFVVETNDMHGKLKSQKTFAENDTIHPISMTYNHYKVANENTTAYQLANKVDVLNDPSGQIQTGKTVGEDLEVMVDMREQYSQTIGANVEINADVFGIPFPPFVIGIPEIFPLPIYSRSQYRSVSVMKVINRYGIIDSVVHVEKGSQVAVKNLVFDGETGEPLLTRTQNEFGDPVYSFNYPSQWAYPASGLAYKNISTFIEGQELHDGQLVASGNNYYYTNGDEVLLKIKLGKKRCDNGAFSYDTYKTSMLAWIVDGTLIGQSSGLYFLDRNGKAITGADAEILVVRSGRRNIAGTVGAVTTLDNPIRTVSSNQYVVYDNLSQVLGSSAAEMKQTWNDVDLRTAACVSTTTEPFNPILHGVLGNWRAFRAHVFYGDRKEDNVSSTVNLRTDGQYKDYYPFWAFSTGGSLLMTSDTSKWVWNAETTLYNPKGMELENHDPLGRYNSGQYGYKNALPTAVTQNSPYRGMGFEGYEDWNQRYYDCASCSNFRHFQWFGGEKEEGINVDSTFAHTGKFSMRVVPDHPSWIQASVLNSYSLGTLGLQSTNENISGTNYCGQKVAPSSAMIESQFAPSPGSSIVISCWVKESQACTCSTYVNNSITVTVNTNTSPVVTNLHPKGNIIEGWQRYEEVIELPEEATAIRIQFNSTASVTSFFDDFRVLPFNAGMKSFVYNPSNLRLMAELDENNYASFYEYDDEGTLVRVKKETERGVKTIQETRSALVKRR